MELQFDVVFKKGTKEIARVSGSKLSEIVSNNLTIGELVEKVTETEQFLEKITGVRVHIEQVL